ncbi:MAG TPA: hypothetical protein VF656_02040 [Pyrinomonadaceae bacterium]
MRRDVEDEQTIRRYLLDDLPTAERQRLEERLLDDSDDLVDRLQLAEAELTDDYVTGELSEDDRMRFREAFLFSSERHEQLRFTELLREHFAATAPLKKTVTDEVRPPAPWLQKLALLLGLNRPAVGFSLACGLILAVSVAAWMGLRTWQLRRQLDQLQARQSPPSAEHDSLARVQQQLDEERARRESATQELAREQDRRAGLEQELSQMKAGGQRETAAAQPTPEPGIGRPLKPVPSSHAGSVLAVTLLSGGVRESGETKTLRLRPEVAVVRLRLDIATGDYSSFRATLEDADGKSLHAKGALRAQSARSGRVVVFNVPASLFGRGGDFRVLLNGVTPEGEVEVIDRYSFRIVPD